MGNGGNYKIDNNGVLVIKGVKDLGEFKCIVENFVGLDDVLSFILFLGMFCMSDLFWKEMMGDEKLVIFSWYGY